MTIVPHLKCHLCDEPGAFVHESYQIAADETWLRVLCEGHSRSQRSKVLYKIAPFVAGMSATFQALVERTCADAPDRP